MLAIVDDLLDVSRIDAGELRVEPEEADLCEVVRDAIERIEPSLKKHTITLHAPAMVCALIDVDRVEQVIANFLTNAIKYSPAGGTIRVEIETTLRQATVKVTDSGIGIPEDAIPRLFERYFRVPGSEKAAKGIGLGLYVTKRLVEAHGGSVAVASEVGKGSTFLRKRAPRAPSSLSGADLLRSSFCARAGGTVFHLRDCCSSTLPFQTEADSICSESFETMPSRQPSPSSS